MPCIYLFVCLITILEPESSYPPDDPDAACKRALCEYDSKAAEYFAKESFDAAYIDYDTSKCWLEFRHKI